MIKVICGFMASIVLMAMIAMPGTAGDIRSDKSTTNADSIKGKPIPTTPTAAQDGMYMIYSDDTVGFATPAGGGNANKSDIGDTLWAHLDDSTAVLWQAINDSTWYALGAAGDTLWAHLDDSTGVLWVAISDSTQMALGAISDSLWDHLGDYLLLAGGTMSGGIDMGDEDIFNIERLDFDTAFCSGDLIQDFAGSGLNVSGANALEVTWEDAAGLDASGAVIDFDTNYVELIATTMIIGDDTLTADAIPAYYTRSEIRNQSGSGMSKGDVVYVSGEQDNKPSVLLAKADAAGTMPAYGILLHDIAHGDDGYVVTGGLLVGLDTDSETEGDPVYVSAANAGEWTITKPTGTNLIQKIGIVIRDHVSAGSIAIVGAGRTNDIPNIAEANFWIGNASGVATAVAMSSDATMIADGTVTVGNDSHDHTGSTISSVDLTTDVTGILPVANGGTGDTDLDDIVGGAAITVTAGENTIIAGNATIALTVNTIDSTFIMPDAVLNSELGPNAADSSNVADGSLHEPDLKITNSPTDNYMLTYDQATDGFSWAAAAGGGAAVWDSLYKHIDTIKVLYDKIDTTAAKIPTAEVADSSIAIPDSIACIDIKVDTRAIIQALDVDTIDISGDLITDFNGTALSVDGSGVLNADYPADSVKEHGDSLAAWANLPNDNADNITDLQTEPRYLVNVYNPNSLWVADSILVALDPRTEAAITITRIEVTCDVDPTTEMDFDLMFCDAFIGNANRTVIDEMNTTNGAISITAGFDDATVPANKCVYIRFNAEPDAGITQVNVRATYTID